MKAAALTFALSLVGSSTGVFAQHPTTVGELIGKGGKKLGAEELAKLVSGSEQREAYSQGVGFMFGANGP